MSAVLDLVSRVGLLVLCVAGHHRIIPIISPDGKYYGVCQNCGKRYV